MLDFYDITGIRFSLRDKRLFEITEVEITRVDYTSIFLIITYDTNYVEARSVPIFDHHVKSPDEIKYFTMLHP